VHGSYADGIWGIDPYVSESSNVGVRPTRPSG